MSEESNQPGPPRDNKVGLQLAGLVAAFLPGVVGISCFHLKQPMPWLLPFLIYLNLFCSIIGAAGVVSRLKNDGAQIIIGLLAFVLFFVLNVFIVIFVGCSGVGRIAP